MPPNGHASQNIPPTITRLITKDILNGNPQVQLAWIANAESPVNPQVKIAKMLFRFDADDNPDGIEVYCVGMIDNRAIGVRTTIRIEDVGLTDEVMDIATWTDEIAAAEDEGEDEPDEPEEPEVPEPEEKPTVTLRKAPQVQAAQVQATPIEPPAALPSPPLPSPTS